MKKLIAPVLLFMCLFTYGQTGLQPSTFSFSADTMSIDRDDKVFAVAVMCPSTSTDSVKIEGVTKTIDGITSTPIVIAPGGVTVAIPNMNVRLTDLEIIAVDEAVVITESKF